MFGGDAHIHLKPDAIPYRVSAARPIPHCFTEPANKTIQNLINNNGIAPCVDPTEMCSLVFFVPKSDGKSFRLVRDFSKLNSFVKRPV